MDNLEKYIKNNAEAFNDAELPDGHLDRFITKLDASPSALRLRSGAAPVGERSRTNERSRATVRRVIWTTVAAAAVLAGIIFINRLDTNMTGHSKDWFANVGNDQAEICRAYYDNVEELYLSILSCYPDGSMDQSISSLAEETIPLVDQLPEEMDQETRAAILKEYYGDLLDGLERMKNIK